MTILGVETSCDETSASLLKKEKNSQKITLLSNAVASSVLLHSKTGGIIPEVAAREQLKYIIPVIKQALIESKVSRKDIDAIAVTVGPGLIGSLLVGVETAKTLAYVWKKPIIPVNHLFGHIYANWLKTNDQRPKTIQFPALALIVSGGHTDLILIKTHGNWKWLGGTRDDAAGEAFDKIARLLSLPYPGGPVIEKLASKGNPKAFNFPRPMINSKDFDFSFSGLKTAVFREINKNFSKGVARLEGVPSSGRREPASEDIGWDEGATGPRTADICASVQQAIIDVLIKKTLQAVLKYKTKSILLGGGVAANQKLHSQFKFKIENLKLKIPLFVPEKWLCTDNAAMIASAAFFNYKEISWQKLTANPEAYFD